MALPSVDKTWVFDINNVCGAAANVTADTQDFLYQLINMLIAAGWAVIGSCDSLTYGNHDGVNRITAPNKFVFGYSSVSSWIILENTALAPHAQLLIWGEGYGASAGAHTMRFSLTGFGTDFGGTNGTLTTAPAGAAATSWTLYQGDRLVYSSPFQCTLHFMRSSDNECTRIIVTDASVLGHVVIGYLAMEKPKDPSPLWTVPVFTTHFTYNNTYNNVMLRPEILGTTSASTNSKTKVNGVETYLYYCGEVVGTSALGDNTSLGATDDPASGWPMIPVSLMSTTYPNRDWVMGLPYDLWFGHYSLVTGDTFPASPAGQLRKFIQMQRVIFPWDGLVIPDGTQIIMG